MLQGQADRDTLKTLKTLWQWGSTVGRSVFSVDGVNYGLSPLIHGTSIVMNDATSHHPL